MIATSAQLRTAAQELSLTHGFHSQAVEFLRDQGAETFQQVQGPTWDVARTLLDELRTAWDSRWEVVIAAGEVLTTTANALKALEDFEAHVRREAWESGVSLVPTSAETVGFVDDATDQSHAFQSALAFIHDAAAFLDEACGTTLDGLCVGADQEVTEVLPTHDPTYGLEHVVVYGDLKTATSVSFLIGGVGSSEESALAGQQERALRLKEYGGEDHAVVLWRGYNAPSGMLAGVVPTAARIGGGELKEALEHVQKLNPDASTILVAHSYGSRVASEAIQQGASPDLLIAVGSPGLGVKSVAELGGTRVISVQNDGDSIALAHGPEGGIHGKDPSDPSFGAERWDLSGDHSSYFESEGFLRRFGEETLRLKEEALKD